MKSNKIKLLVVGTLENSGTRPSSVAQYGATKSDRLPNRTEPIVRKGRVTALLLGATALSGLSYQAPALAEGEGAAVLEEVVVTARFREENLQQTPIAITAMSGDFLQERSLTNVEDIGAVVPNAFTRPGLASYGGAPTIFIRGVGQTDFLFAFEPGVGVYIDNVYHSTLLGSDMDLLDIEQVEVLRGPQGTLFGKNSLGGAIRINSKKPMGDNSGTIQVAYGSYDRMDLQASFDMPLVEDKVFMRVAGAAKQRDGYQDIIDFTCRMQRQGTPELAGLGDGLGADGSAGGALDGMPDTVTPGSAADNAFSFPEMPSAGRGNTSNPCKVGTYGGEDTQAVRLMLRYLASDNLEINLSADHTKNDSEAAPSSQISVPQSGIDMAYNAGKVYPAYGISIDDRFLTGDPYETFKRFQDPFTGESWPNKASLETWGVGATVDYDISSLVQLKVIGAYRRYDSQNTSNSTGTLFPLSMVYNVPEHEQYSAEVQLTGDALNSALEWTLGGFYFESKSSLGGRVVLAPLNFLEVLPPFDNNDRFDSENKSAFAHLVYNLSDRLSVTGGVRYTDEEKSYSFDHPPLLTIDEPAVAGLSRFDWKVGMDYQLTDTTFAYGQVSTGFRSPGFNPRPFTPVQLRSFPKEDLIAYELGFKSDVLDGMGRINLAAFYSDYSSRVISTDAQQCNLNPNTDETAFLGTICPPGTDFAGDGGIPWGFYLATSGNIYGFELETTFNPVTNLRFDASLGYNKFESDVDDPGAPGYIHPDVYNQPRWNASAGVQYKIEIGKALITPRLDWFYSGKGTYGPIDRAPEPSEIIGAYSVFNGRISFDSPDRNWNLSLAVTNIFDKFYYNGLFGSIPEDGGGQAGMPSRPREWSATVTRYF